jgi:hypothetical protein
MSKLIHNIFRGKYAVAQKFWLPPQLKKRLKENNPPIGENSPNHHRKCITERKKSLLRLDENTFIFFRQTFSIGGPVTATAQTTAPSATVGLSAFSIKNIFVANSFSSPSNIQTMHI